jgi:hypothetical protein
VTGAPPTPAGSEPAAELDEPAMIALLGGSSAG